MAVIEIARIQVRRGQESVTGVPQLAPGEMGWAEDTENLYIGKRIVEGAKDDNNTRILTENDLVNVFAMIAPGSTVASTSSYQYREYGVQDGVTTATFANVNALYVGGVRPSISMALKLDQTVSLADFSNVWPPVGHDITLLTNAVLKDLYANTATNMPRVLKIPAGNYYVHDTLKLPPNTHLIGEGKDITVLNLINDQVDLMQTVDKLGNTFGNMTNNQAVNPTNVCVENMTLSFNTGTKSTQSLLSFDNTRNAVARSVKFNGSTYTGFTTVVTGASTASGSTQNLFVAGTATYPALANLSHNAKYAITGNSIYSNDIVEVSSFSYAGGFIRMVTTSSAAGIAMNFGSTSTEVYSVYIFEGGGTGVYVRTQDDGGSNANSNNIPFSENTQLIDCDFSNLDTGIISTGSTFKTVITNNTFRNSYNGIKLYTDSINNTANGPLSVQITRNIFDTVYKQGIMVGSNPNDMPSNVLSSYNYFTQVGNGLEQPTKGISDSNITHSAYPIIEFDSQGNLSSNDFFNRVFEATTATASASFFYNLVAKGSTNIQDQTAKSITIPNNSITPVVRFPLTNTEQLIEIKYQMSNEFLSRKGTASLNVRANAYSTSPVSVSDNYIYTEEQSPYNVTYTNGLTSDASSSYDSLVISSNSPGLTLVLNDLVSKNINGGNSTLYVTGNTEFAGLAAYVIAVSAITSSTFQIVTQSSSPQFNYDPAIYPLERWSLLTADNPIFGTYINTVSNFITLNCDSTGVVNTSSGVTYNITFQTDIFQK
jgi:Pectate lyase superfamily protein